MSENKAPNAVVVSAQRLQDLRDLCQPSNFNTTEQAHSALHNGISKLLNERNPMGINPARLIPGDRFFLGKPTEDDVPYEVFDRVTVVRPHINLMERSINQAVIVHETYILFGTCGWKCYLKLSDMTSYYDITEGSEPHVKFPETVFLDNPL